MLRRATRTATYTALALAARPARASALERRLAGDNAVTRRALMANRALMAIAMRRAKQAS